MKKLAGVLPLIMTLMLCLAAFCTGVFSIFADAKKQDTALQANTGAAPLKNYLSIGALISEQAGSADSSKGSSSVAVNASPSDAIGKIHEQFISPYGVALKYNGIYIKNSTGLSVNIKNELSAQFDMKLKNTSDPQVLIVHTHTTESYMSEDRGYYTAADKSRSTDNTKNMVAVGEAFASVLRKGGIGVIHATTQHDHPAYNGSYGRAKTTINEYLKKYPSIKIVVDLHRDSIAMTGNDKCKPVKKIDGKKAAQVMLVIGSETGSVSGFPNWRQNFRLALRYQQTMEAMYPGLARAMTFCSRKYNMNLTTGSMLLEVGTDSNTLEEACYSAELAGKALLSLLNTLK